MSPLLCQEEREVQSYPTSPTTRPYPPNNASRTAGTPLYPPLCGGDLETQWYTAPPRAPIPQIGEKGLGCIRRCVGRSSKCNHTRTPRRGVPIPHTAQAGPEGLGVIAPVCGGAGSAIVHGSTTGCPYPVNGPGRTGGTRVYSPLCGEELKDQSYPTPQTGRPYPPNGPRRTKGTRVYLPLCGENLEVESYPTPPQGLPIPQTARSGLVEVGCV